MKLMTQKNETLIEILAQMRNIMMLNKSVWTVEDLSCYTGYSPSYIYKMVHYGTIPYCKNPSGNKLFFNKETILEWLTEIKVAPRNTNQIIFSTKIK